MTTSSGSISISMSESSSSSLKMIKSSFARPSNRARASAYLPARNEGVGRADSGIEEADARLDGPGGEGNIVEGAGFGEGMFLRESRDGLRALGLLGIDSDQEKVYRFEYIVESRRDEFDRCGDDRRSWETVLSECESAKSSDRKERNSFSLRAGCNVK